MSGVISPPVVEGSIWSGRRDSNPRPPAWKAWRWIRCAARYGPRYSQEAKNVQLWCRKRPPKGSFCLPLSLCQTQELLRCLTDRLYLPGDVVKAIRGSCPYGHLLRRGSVGAPYAVIAGGWGGPRP